MRVKGNVTPGVLTIEPYRSKDGYVEARLRENIKSIVEMDEMTGQGIPMFEYDEYTFILPDREGLREDIEANMADWLATGRHAEFDPQASEACRIEEEYTAELAELVEAIYESDMEVIENV